MSNVLVIGIITLIIFVLLFSSMFWVKKHSKNKYLKIGLAITVVLTIIYFVIFSIDYNRVVSFRNPIFVWQRTSKNTNYYQGVGYKIYVETEKSKITSYAMLMFDHVIAGSIQ